MALEQSPSQTIGPMYGYALYREGLQRTVDPADPGAVVVSGLVLDGDGEPIAYPDAMLEVWEGEQLARARTDPFGRWQVVVRRPAHASPLPDGTPQAPHLNVALWARGLTKQANTRIYFPEEEANAEDPVLARVEPERVETLVAHAQEDGTLRFDIHVQGERETVFFAF